MPAIYTRAAQGQPARTLPRHSDWADRLWPPFDCIAWLSPFYYFSPYELVAGSPLCLENLLVLWAIAMTGFTVAYVTTS